MVSPPTSASTPPDATNTTDDEEEETTTTAGAAPAPADLDECERAADQANAQLAYEPERSMTVGNEYEVTAALSLSGPPDVTFEGTTTIIVLPDIHCTITAALTGADFNIIAKSNATQSFLDTRVLDWRWDVRPRREGDDLALTLSLQSSVVQDGTTLPGRTALYVTDIDVDVKPASFWRRFGRGSLDFLTYPLVAPVTALALGAVATWIARRAHLEYKKRRASAAPAQPARDTGTTHEPTPGPDP